MALLFSIKYSTHTKNELRSSHALHLKDALVNMLCISTSKCMLAHAFAWSKTIENIQKSWSFLHAPYMSLSYAWWKRYFFMLFKSFFYHFWPCERMHKHAFAGQNTQHAQNETFASTAICSLNLRFKLKTATTTYHTISSNKLWCFAYWGANHITPLDTFSQVLHFFNKIIVCNH